MCNNCINLINSKCPEHNQNIPDGKRKELMKYYNENKYTDPWDDDESNDESL